MAKLLVYFVHPGRRFSRVNSAMQSAANKIDGITHIDLYAEYPRHNINVDREQDRLRAHDVILFQFPLFWYSTPSLLKEWQDLVLEHGFAYGSGGDALKGKTLMLAVTAAGAQDAYTASGYQNFELRTFLTPLEQTATLCQMTFAPPYVLFSSLSAPEGPALDAHVDGYRRLLNALRDDRFDMEAATQRDLLTCADLPIRKET